MKQMCSTVLAHSSFSKTIYMVRYPKLPQERVHYKGPHFDANKVNLRIKRLSNIHQFHASGHHSPQHQQHQQQSQQSQQSQQQQQLRHLQHHPQPQQLKKRLEEVIQERKEREQRRCENGGVGDSLPLSAWPSNIKGRGEGGGGRFRFLFSIF